MGFIRTEKVTEIPAPITRRNGKRVHPADVGACLVHGTLPFLQECTDIQGPGCVQQEDGETVRKPCGVGVLSQHIFYAGHRFPLVPQMPGQTVAIQGFQHNAVLYIAAAAAAQPAVERNLFVQGHSPCVFQVAYLLHKMRERTREEFFHSALSISVRPPYPGPGGSQPLGS